MMKFCGVVVTVQKTIMVFDRRCVRVHKLVLRHFSRVQFHRLRFIPSLVVLSRSQTPSMVRRGNV